PRACLAPSEASPGFDQPVPDRAGCRATTHARRGTVLAPSSWISSLFLLCHLQRTSSFKQQAHLPQDTGGALELLDLERSVQLIDHVALTAPHRFQGVPARGRKADKRRAAVIGVGQQLCHALRSPPVDQHLHLLTRALSPPG